ncbi:hypothetical protein CF65_02717 [Aggregatibacter actinomycetemcomitans HK1651]|nr:hypothetical protein CF65_02717 [Aggregatibacter actinomycetemcomitans HK1651]
MIYNKYPTFYEKSLLIAFHYALIAISLAFIFTVAACIL